MARAPKKWVTTRQRRNGLVQITWWVGRRKWYVIVVPADVFRVQLDVPLLHTHDGAWQPVMEEGRVPGWRKILPVA